MVFRNLLSHAQANFGAEAMISHNSWMDWAREPVKISLDAWDRKESNQLDKNIPLHLQFLREIHICEVNIRVRQICKKSVIRITDISGYSTDEMTRC